MVAEPVGAGAGRTGGANALGEAIFGHGEGGGVPAELTERGVVLVVHDESGLSGPDRPIQLLTNWRRWGADESLAMRRREDGAWEIRLPRRPEGILEAFAFRFALGPGGRPEVDASGEVVGERRLPRVQAEEAAGAEPLVYEFRARGFGPD
jgi:hypothetical protein